MFNDQSLFCVSRLVLAAMLIGLAGCAWDQDGYGNIAVLRGDGATLYEYTRATCMEVEDLDDESIDDLFGDAVLVEEDVLETYDDGIPGLSFPVRLHSKSGLPETCRGEKLIETASPTATFEHFWHTFNDYYAFFEERGVDWPAQYAAFVDQVDDEMSDEALFQLLSDMLSPIDDGHVSLESDFDDYSPEKSRGIFKILEESFEQQNKFDDYDEYEERILDQYEKVIAKNYLDPASLKTVDAPILWGTIEGRIGYLAIESMEDLSEADEDGDSELRADVAVVNELIPQILEDFRDMDAIIIDVRLNGGGFDAVALAIASHFGDRRFTVATKFARSHLGETERVSVDLRPSDDPWLKPVAVIGGPNSASATEIFLIAIRALPHVITVGQRSNGILSDILGKTLPNDWEVGFSNEVYLDFEEKSYEVTGVPVDVYTSIFSLEEMAEKRNVAIDAAIDALDRGNTLK